MDLTKVEALLKLMKTYGADSVRIEDADLKITVKMTPARPVVQLPGVSAGSGPAVPAASTADQAGPAEALESVLCPTIGVFYAAPGPEEPPFVRVGDHVDKDTILCIVEAMKVMNEIPAGVAGTITEILPVNGDRVEYEQPLFRIRADA